MTPENPASLPHDTAILLDELIAKDESDALAMLRSKHAGARLLVVEDSPANLDVALTLVLAAALKADMAENGRLAVEKVALMQYDLILMDVQMPMMNGLEASRAIRLQPGGGNVPILAMTANAFAEARQACLEAGMNDFVAKPFSPHDFYATLLKWLSTTTQSCSPLLPPLLHLTDAHQEAVTAPTASIKPEIEPGQVADLLAHLETFLEHGNIKANYLARDKAGLLQRVFGNSVKAFLARIEAFDYESALAELHKIRSHQNNGVESRVSKPGAA
ncbi:MAG: response regulator [Azonexus sp.]